MSSMFSFPPIKIHPIIIIFVFISFITGMFYHVIIIFVIVLIHELGHYFAAKILKWKIIYIKLWIFGGVLVTEEYISRPLKEQLLVTLAGPFQHFPIFLFIYISSIFDLFSPPILELILFYNTIILLFNFLPIWPLDGGKILFIFLCSFLPYRVAYSSTIASSLILASLLLLAQLLFFSFTLSASLIMIYLLVENYTEWKQRFYLFIQFLFQRKNKKTSSQSTKLLQVPENMKLIDVLSSFMLEKDYIIKVIYKNKFEREITEKHCLESFFKNPSSHEKIGNLLM